MSHGATGAGRDDTTTVAAESVTDGVWTGDRSPSPYHQFLAGQMRAAGFDPASVSDSAAESVNKPTLRALLDSISAYYQVLDEERRGVVRSMQLMSDAAQSVSREAAEQSSGHLQLILDHITDVLITLDADGRVRTLNRTGERVFGYTEAEVLGRRIDSLVPGLADFGSLRRALETRELRELRARRRGGTEFQAELAVSATRVEYRDVYIVCLRDVTDRQRAEQAVFAEKERAQVTLQAIGDAVIATDAAGVIEYLNPVAERLTGWSAADARGRDIDSVLTLQDDVKREPLANPVRLCLANGEAVSHGDHALLIDRRGMEIAIQDSASPIRDRKGELIGAVVVFHDVTRERRLKRALAYQATHDALTGLINRREFDNRLQLALERAARGEARHVLIYLDLDQFKIVNDTCGHPAGDRLIREITSILQTRVRASDVIARLGGDEFGILLEDCSVEHALTIAESLRQGIADHRFVWGARSLGVGASIGLVEMDGSTETVASAMSAADIACYAAKDQGRNRVQLYDSGRTSGRHREMYWVSRVTEAIEENRFVLFAQRMAAIARPEDSPLFYELSVRLVDGDGKLVLPGEFEPAAERYDVMSAIDRWVMRQAVSVLAARAEREELLPLLSIAVSGSSLVDPGFLDAVLSHLGDPRVARSLCFELTETAAVASLPNAIYFMKELKARGCRFALDDFGSGLSSFRYLKTLPVDFVKIDGEFVANVATQPIDRSMVEAITQVGRALGIRTIAERVESSEALLELERIGVDFAQGVHIGAAMPATELFSAQLV